MNELIHAMLNEVPTTVKKSTQLAKSAAVEHRKAWFRIEFIPRTQSVLPRDSIKYALHVDPQQWINFVAATSAQYEQGHVLELDCCACMYPFAYDTLGSLPEDTDVNAQLRATRAKSGWHIDLEVVQILAGRVAHAQMRCTIDSFNIPKTPMRRDTNKDRVVVHYVAYELNFQVFAAVDKVVAQQVPAAIEVDNGN